MKLFWKNSNLRDRNPPTSQTEGRPAGQTTCDRKTALFTKVHRAVKIAADKYGIINKHENTDRQATRLLLRQASPCNHVRLAYCNKFGKICRKRHPTCSSNIVYDIASLLVRVPWQLQICLCEFHPPPAEGVVLLFTPLSLRASGHIDTGSVFLQPTLCVHCRQ